MSDNTKLLKEIYNDKEMTKNCFYSSFKNKADEEELSMFKYQYYQKLRLFTGIAVIGYGLSMTVYFYLDTHSIGMSVIHVLMNIMNISFLIIIYKSDPNTKLNVSLCYIKFFLNLANYVHYIVYIIIALTDYIELSKEYNKGSKALVRNFYLNFVAIFMEYCFYIKPSKFISYLVMVIYLLITISACIFNNQNDHTILLPEVFACFAVYFVFSCSEIIWSFKREIFIYLKQTQTLGRYYESLLNNMQLQIVSLYRKDYIMYNSTFYNQTMSDKPSINSLHINNNSEVREIKEESKDDKMIKFNEYLSTLVNIDSESTSLFSIIEEISDNKMEKDGLKQFDYFKSLGTFSLKNNKRRFYSVFYRLFYLEASNESDIRFIIDVYINEITEIKAAENILSETKIKQKLFSKFAHEFKTPMIIIKSLLTDINEKVHNNHPLSEIITLSKHTTYLSDYIQFLINDIICYSNEQSVSISLAEVNIKETLEFCYGVCNSLISVMPGRKNNIKAIIDYDIKLTYFTCISDKIRLRQILLNLISNSVKFTKSGEIVIGAELIKTESVNIIDNHIEESITYSAHIFVKDTGIGIKEDDLRRIKSNELIRINIENDYNEMGTGIGISIVKNLINKLNHFLNINSTYEKGSEFGIIISNIVPKDNWSERSSNIKTVQGFKCSTINLNDLKLNGLREQTRDFLKRSSKEMIHVSNHIEKETELNISSKHKIIICDDSQTLRKSVRNLISSNREMSVVFDIVECYDGADMLFKVIEDQSNGNLIKLIITDENMEYMAGSTAISIIKEWEYLKKIKNIYIVSLTAFADELTINNIIKKGANIVLNKPLSQVLLQDLYQKFKSLN